MGRNEIVWRTSSYRAKQTCVEVVAGVLARDSKNPSDLIPAWGPRTWRGFLASGD